MNTHSTTSNEGWQDIATAPEMIALLLRHEYYSHGQVRHGYSRNGCWIGVNANGTEAALQFNPTHWRPLPAPPVQS